MQYKMTAECETSSNLTSANNNDYTDDYHADRELEKRRTIAFVTKLNKSMQ